MKETTAGAAETVRDAAPSNPFAGFFGGGARALSLSYSQDSILRHYVACTPAEAACANAVGAKNAADSVKEAATEATGTMEAGKCCYSAVLSWPNGMLQTDMEHMGHVMSSRAWP